MAKFCTECGKEMAEGVAFCTECGTKAPVDPTPEMTEAAGETAEVVNETTEAVSETTEAAGETTEPKAEAPYVHTPPAQSDHQTQQPQYQSQPIYQQSPAARPAPAVEPTSKVVSTGTFFWLMLLFALPVIGQIACIIMMLVPKNKNIRHFAKATLIWVIIALVMIGVFVALIVLFANTLMDYINELTGGQFDGLGDLFDKLGE